MKSRILVVDDDRSILELLRLLLESEGYQVQAFDSAAAALKDALSRPPDAAVIDLMMPGMNGLDLIRALRYDPRTRTLPILVCSAYSGDLPRSLLDLKQDRVLYLRKPFHIQELLDAVGRLTARPRERLCSNGRRAPRKPPASTPAPTRRRVGSGSRS